MKLPLLDIIARQIKGEFKRELQFVVNYPRYKSITMRITQTAGHWTMFGSVLIRMENLPLNYNGTDLEANIIMTLLELGEGVVQLLPESVQLNEFSIELPNPEAFEEWLKEQLPIVWNDP